MSESCLLIENRAPIAWVTLHRPAKLNALNDELLKKLDSARKTLEYDSDISVIVINGAGDRAFCAGADLSELQQRDSDKSFEHSKMVQGIFNRIAECKKPIIAAINGLALGGGLELALACHLRLASENATLGLPELGLGLIPALGGISRLQRLVGMGLATEMVLTGATIPANKALAMGLVNRMLPAADLLPECEALARAISTKPAAAVQTALEGLRLALDRPLEASLAWEAKQFGHLIQRSHHP